MGNIKGYKNYDINNVLYSLYEKPLVIDASDSENDSDEYVVMDYENSESFFRFLVLFYPSVSKILTGANSNTLEDAQYSIPIGTLGASAGSIFSCNFTI